MQATIAYINIWEYFTSTKLEGENEQSINLDVSVWDILTTMQTMLGLCKTLTNFTLKKIEKLAQLVVANITSLARSIEEPHRIFGQPSKLVVYQHLFNFIFYVKHNNVIKYDDFTWN